MFFDTHAHYDDAKFDEDRMEVLAAMPSRGVELILNPGCDMKTSRMAVSFADKFDFMYAAVGIHPQAADEFAPEDIAELRKLAENPKVRAIGEIGLEYYYDDGAPREVQIECLDAQLELARELHLPVVIHDREATADCLDTVRRFPDVCGVFHCFSGSWETAKVLLDKGWYLSFTGAVTFKNARRAPEVVSKMPLDRLMLETDAPYLAPVPNRGKRCDSTMLIHTAECIATLRNTTAEDIARLTLENGKRFFGIE